jgi:hypothetical protein
MFSSKILSIAPFMINLLVSFMVDSVFLGGMVVSGI